MPESRVRQRLAERGVELPACWSLPPDADIPADFVVVDQGIAYLSGHLPTDLDGSVTALFGTVGGEIDLGQAQDLATAATLNLIATLEAAIGDLDRVQKWLRVDGLVNAAPDFTDYPAVFNPASKLLVEAFGSEVGRHCRLAYGAAGLPWNAPVEIAATVRVA
ncbi:MULTISPECIES: RidA family protein [unclassified Rhodococcus (in: high G+C Gram-positive bacteria)]|uniref:RidA family protein n=1 Tax=unclassified Rhodococcus (in: high G+C Gram-positive bacteria) TaxID=192944 RepID=UPI000B9B3BB9|nr:MULTISPECIES: RidA family protein [unclassified Rhodococcus (in: high G+C Gram-positive bacteria)]OZC81686.1 hypothetical protein CH274_09805 [Rhodococcus sp. 06-418-5]OZD48001.1 hypothetical protein CH264_07760 [Rhodococcus sp. 06-1477-1A]OZE73339.1 hypothetical protein CH305_27360 [Rhodococcus sp. 15-649-2-2]OZE75111.1 hypothetical protein CH304_26390 [Rhodococcus sp. 15-649-1-2]